MLELLKDFIYSKAWITIRRIGIIMVLFQTVLAFYTNNWSHVIGWSIFLMFTIVLKDYILDIVKLRKSYKDWQDSQNDSKD